MINNNINNDLINSLPDDEIIQDCIIQTKGDKFKKFYFLFSCISY